MAYGDVKDLKRRTASDKILRDKILILLKALNMMDIKEDLLLWFINVLVKIPLHLQISLYQAVVFIYH